MSTLHTPAPWSDDTGPLVGADGRQVGEPERGVDLLAQYPRIMADKALIRAAPELAAALRFMDEWKALVPHGASPPSAKVKGLLNDDRA